MSGEKIKSTFITILSLYENCIAIEMKWACLHPDRIVAVIDAIVRHSQMLVAIVVAHTVSACVRCPLVVNQQTFIHSLRLFLSRIFCPTQCLHLFGKLTKNFSYSLPVNWTFFSKMTLQPLTIAFVFCLSR